MKPAVHTRRKPGAPNDLSSATSAGEAVANWPLGGPDIGVEYHALAELKLPKRQLRKHNKKQVAQIEALIRRAGFINPIIVDGELGIVAGIGRYLAAKNLNLSRVPVIKVEHLSEAELRAYAIADNKLVLNDSWDEELLTIELTELMNLDFDLPIELTAFDTVEIDNLVIGRSSKAARQAEAEALEPSPNPPVSQVGDLFVLGEHRLLCGDSRSEASYRALMGDTLARMVFSDNPYNIKILGNVSGLGRVKHDDFVAGAGELSRTEFTAFLTDVWTHCAAYSIDGAIHFQCMDHRHLREVLDAGEAVYSELKTLIVWDKQVGGMGSFYRNQFELIFAFKVGTAAHRNTFGLGEKGRHRTNLWSYPGAAKMRVGRLEDLALHPTIKNLTMVADAIRDVSDRGDIVLDPFAGASTTILAAERTARKARCIELDPKYVDVGIKRWEKATGKRAIHVETGCSFNELAMLRADVQGEED